MKSQIPLLTINLLQALPKTPLWDRLEREGRLIDDDGRDSNVEFLLPYDQVVRSWRKCMEVAYQPEKLFARYEYQMRLHLSATGSRCRSRPSRRAGPTSGAA